MGRQYSAIFLSLVFWTHFFGVQFAVAWWDQGHLLSTAIARYDLTDEEAAILERPLQLWDPAFDGLNTITTSSVWADHIKCYSRAPYCNGLATLPNFSTFDTWHYTTFIYKPEEFDIPGIDAYQPLPETGVLWALQNLLRSVPNSADWTFGTAAPPTQADRLESTFSWNMKLRLVAHFIGDLHCPVHATTLFTPELPAGDRGANYVRLDLSQATVVPNPQDYSNLHALWDACGGQYTTNWPDMTEEKAREMAAELRAEFPKENYEERLKINNFEDLAEETREITRTRVYVDELWNTELFRTSQRFAPTDDYLRDLQFLCREQITLAGYRAGIILKAVASHLKSATWDASSPSTDSAFSIAAFSSVILIALLPALAL